MSEDYFSGDSDNDRSDDDFNECFCPFEELTIKGDVLTNYCDLPLEVRINILRLTDPEGYFTLIRTDPSLYRTLENNPKIYSAIKTQKCYEAKILEQLVSELKLKQEGLHRLLRGERDIKLRNLGGYKFDYDAHIGNKHNFGCMSEIDKILFQLKIINRLKRFNKSSYHSDYLKNRKILVQIVHGK